MSNGQVRQRVTGSVAVWMAVITLSSGASMLGLAGCSTKGGAPATHTASGVNTRGSVLLADKGVVGSVEVRVREQLAGRSVLDKAAGMFRGDLAKVSGGANPEKQATVTSVGGVVVGVVGDPESERMFRELGVNVEAIRGKWEHYLIAAGKKPKSANQGVQLVVVGSDPRGAAYGLMALSEKIGVSPWTWWADVPVVQRDQVVVSVADPIVDGPKVKYRGFFINDEDWGLEPWARHTFDRESGSIGPKTYEKIFELMLRLRANTLWPGMHLVTKSFNSFRENPKLAAEYGIVMGSSHCEPLLTNNEAEWSREVDGAWSWETNREGILAFLGERVRENSKFESLWTVGMRGIHDRPLDGGGDLNGKTRRLEDIFAAERKLLAPLGGGDPSKVPQVFIPYKEVLEIYNNGLKVPDDVTLMWVDDNHGWIRRLPNEEERKRSGGSGVYYHLSYWGRPQSYLWLDTTPPAQVWAEMTKAAAYGVDRVWVVNVGDIKSIEKGTDYFLQLAWNPSNPKLADQAGWLRQWSGQSFGQEHAEEIGAILSEYYRLCWGNRPEHIGRNIEDDQLLDPEIADAYMAACDKLYARTLSVGQKLRPEYRDAYFQLVEYPVSGMTGTVVKVLSARESRRVVERDSARAQKAADRAEAAWKRIVEDTRRYNEVIAGGKWRRIMHNEPLPGNERNSSSLTPPLVSRKPGDPGRETRPGPKRPTVRLSVRDAGVKSAGGATFKLLDGLGTDGTVAVAEPRVAVPVVDDKKSARLDWVFESATSGEVRLMINALPTHHPSGMSSQGGVKCAVRVNDGPLQWAEFSYDHSGRDWSKRVLVAKMSTTVSAQLAAGKQKVAVYAMGSDVVIDSVEVFKP